MDIEGPIGLNRNQKVPNRRLAISGRTVEFDNSVLLIARQKQASTVCARYGHYL
jgi:hypothetical protein